jgi:hypothetical protein
MPRLPPELIDHIIDHFDYDNLSDLRDLYACALVCKAWVAPSRAHLFHTVEIGRPHRPRTYCAIRKFPDLAVYVRELYFANGSGAEEVALELLPLFTTLRKLAFFHTHWTSLNPETRNSFHRALALPSLIHLNLVGMTFDTRERFEGLLHPQLKRLVVFDSVTQHDRDSVVNEATKRQPCLLEYLRHDTDPVFADWLLGAQTTIDVTNLRTLYLTGVVSTCARNLSRMLQALRSLEHLRLHDHDGCMPSFYLFQFIL